MAIDWKVAPHGPLEQLLASLARAGRRPRRAVERVMTIAKRADDLGVVPDAVQHEVAAGDILRGHGGRRVEIRDSMITHHLAVSRRKHAHCRAD